VKFLKKFLEALTIPVILLIIWSILTFTNIVPSYILPSPYEVLTAFYNLIITGELFLHAMSTLLRVVAGFSVAAMIAIPLGIGIGWSEALERIFNPIIQILRPIPPLAWVPFALLWFGLGLKAEAFIIFIGSFFPILLNRITKRVHGSKSGYYYPFKFHKCLIQIYYFTFASIWAIASPTVEIFSA